MDNDELKKEFETNVAWKKRRLDDLHIQQLRREWLIELLRGQNGLCAYCGMSILPRKDRSTDPNSTYATVDHIVPLSCGGPDDIENTLAACNKCNKAKGSMSLDDFRSSEFLKKRRKTFEPSGKSRHSLFLGKKVAVIPNSFDLSIGNETYSNLTMAFLMFHLISGLLKRGVTPLDLSNASPKKNSPFFEAFEGTLTEEVIVEKIKEKDRDPRNARYKQYVTKADHVRFFIEEGQIFHIDGQTYVLTNQWNIREMKSVDKFVKAFKNIRIHIKQKKYQPVLRPIK
jgi:5-methylcytosine-specific restriction endonuclease McrA